MRILMIDDQENLIKVWKIFLEKCGHKFFAPEFLDEDLIQVALKEGTEAVILDYNIQQDFTGLDILKKFKDVFPKIKWYANSCSVESNNKLIKAGCCGVIWKNLKELQKVFY